MAPDSAPPRLACQPLDAKQTADAALVVYAQEKVASVRRLHRLRPRMAVLSAREQMEEGEVNRARSIIGSEFVCRIGRPTTIGGRAAIVPLVSGRAWITGVSQYMLHLADQWPSGYRLTDAWPRIREAI